MNPETVSLAGFPVAIQLPVQWGEQDAFGHVNNVTYFRWLESARIAYLERVKMGHDLQKTGIGPILAAIKCDYRRQLTYPDSVIVGARVTRIGRSSLTMQHAVFSVAQSAMIAEGEGVIVAFEYATNRSCPLPDDVRRAMEALEGHAL